MSLTFSDLEYSWPPVIDLRPQPLRIPDDDLENDHVAVSSTSTWSFKLVLPSPKLKGHEETSPRKAWKNFLRLPRRQPPVNGEATAGRNDELYLCISPFLVPDSPSSASPSSASTASSVGLPQSPARFAQENAAPRQRGPQSARPAIVPCDFPGRPQTPRNVSQGSVLQPEDALLAFAEGRQHKRSVFLEAYSDAPRSTRRFSLPDGSLTGRSELVPPVLDPVPHHSLNIPGIDKGSFLLTSNAADMAHITSEAARQARSRRRKNRSRDEAGRDLEVEAPPPSYEVCINA